MLVVRCLSVAVAQAQWLNYPTPGVPRTKDGKVNLTAPMPKTADGKPDLSGVWHVQPTGLIEIKRLFGNDVDKVQVPDGGRHHLEVRHQCLYGLQAG